MSRSEDMDISFTGDQVNFHPVLTVRGRNSYEFRRFKCSVALFTREPQAAALSVGGGAVGGRAFCRWGGPAHYKNLSPRQKASTRQIRDHCSGLPARHNWRLWRAGESVRGLFPSLFSISVTLFYNLYVCAKLCTLITTF